MAGCEVKPAAGPQVPLGHGASPKVAQPSGDCAGDRPYARTAPSFQPTHRWWWKAKLGDRHGQPCAVLARGKMNSSLVAFADGHRVLTSRHAVRRLG